MAVSPTSMPGLPLNVWAVRVGSIPQQVVNSLMPPVRVSIAIVDWEYHLTRNQSIPRTEGRHGVEQLGEPQQAAIELREVTKAFGGKAVLDRISLSIRRGEFFVLVGSSGSGKSTLLKMVS